MCAKLYISQIKWPNCTHFSYNAIEKTKFIAFSIVNKIKKDFNWIATGKIIFNRYFGEFPSVMESGSKREECV